MKLTHGFWIGQTLVTQAAYRKVAGKNPSAFKGDRLPVETVSWDEAKAYCQAVKMRLRAGSRMGVCGTRGQHGGALCAARADRLVWRK